MGQVHLMLSFVSMEDWVGSIQDAVTRSLIDASLCFHILWQSCSIRCQQAPPDVLSKIALIADVGTCVRNGGDILLDSGLHFQRRG